MSDWHPRCNWCWAAKANPYRVLIHIHLSKNNIRPLCRQRSIQGCDLHEALLAYRTHNARVRQARQQGGLICSARGTKACSSLEEEAQQRMWKAAWQQIPKCSSQPALAMAWPHGRTHAALTLMQWGHQVAKYLTTTGCRQVDGTAQASAGQRSCSRGGGQMATLKLRPATMQQGVEGRWQSSSFGQRHAAGSGNLPNLALPWAAMQTGAPMLGIMHSLWRLHPAVRQW